MPRGIADETPDLVEDVVDLSRDAERARTPPSAPGTRDRDRKLALVVVGHGRPPALPRPEGGRVEYTAQGLPVGGGGAYGAHVGWDVVAALEPVVVPDVVGELDLGEREGGEWKVSG